MNGRSLRDSLSLAVSDADFYDDLGEGYPDLLILHKAKGVIAVSACASPGEEAQARKTLRAQFRTFLEDFESGKKLPRSELVVSLPLQQETFVREIRELPDQALDAEILREFVDEFRPVMSFEAVLHSVDPDEGRVERERTRFVLDQNQEKVAKEPPAEVTVLTGPAGSGKSLVLLARARLIARANPDWKIQIVCFNRGLVPYLKANVAEIESVNVGTFSSWAYENGYRLNLKSCVSSWIGYEKAQRSGIYQNIDLLLVDEFQDFCSAWLSLLLDSLTPGRGGAILAGDDQQRLYRDPDIEQALEGRDTAEHALEIPYRSTRQILEVVGILDPDQSVPGIEHAPDGNPVEIVWTEANLQDKAGAIAHICSRLVENGFLKGDIAVLATNKYMIGTITAILKDSGVEAEARYSNKIEADDLPWSNSVKVMTVHSAKGLEFPAILLVGIDELKNPDEAKDVEQREQFERFERLNLVGPTRAKDLLFILAAKENSYIRRVKEIASDLEMHHWPEDYR